MPLWIPVAIAAAAIQTIRFMVQKSLSRVQLSATGATFARFAYSAPLIVLSLTAYLGATGQGLPPLPARFWIFVLAGGTTQIIATICVVALFRQRNFAVGVTFTKTEVVLTALVGLAVLGEQVSRAGLGAILLGLVAVLLLSKTPGVAGVWWRHLGSRASVLGVSSGALFAVASVSYRGASLELTGLAPGLRAAITLAAVVSFQMLSMAAWLAWRDPGELRAVWRARATAVWIGLLSMVGSFGWFLAFTLQNAAYVKALGQIDLIFSLLASVLFFRERIGAREMAGMAILSLSILALVLLA